MATPNHKKSKHKIYSRTIYFRAGSQECHCLHHVLRLLLLKSCKLLFYHCAAYKHWLEQAHDDCCLCMPDGIMYWEDGAETLAAFVEAFPPGAGLLMQSKGAVIVQLASVYDNLLPDVNASLARLSPAVTLPVSLVPPTALQSAIQCKQSMLGSCCRCVQQVVV